MKRENVVSALVGGAAIYLAFAACSGSNDLAVAKHSIVDAGLDVINDVSGLDVFADAHGSDVVTDVSTWDDVGDSLINPVKDAKADTPPAPDATQLFTSGTRLKAKYQQGEDGSRQFIGWYDSKLKEDCWFVQTKDGLRCLPGLYSSSTMFFLDANCTHAIAMKQNNCSASQFYASAASPAGSCQPVYTVGKYGAAITSLPDLIYYGEPGNCKGTASKPYAGKSFYEVVEVPNSEFVAAEIQIDK